MEIDTDERTEIEQQNEAVLGDQEARYRSAITALTCDGVFCAVDRRPKRDPASFKRVTDRTRFSNASYRIIGTARDPIRDVLSTTPPMGCRHYVGGPALDAYSHQLMAACGAAAQRRSGESEEAVVLYNRSECGSLEPDPAAASQRVSFWTNGAHSGSFMHGTRCRKTLGR